MRILKAGLQATLQGAARAGHRHMGIPRSGPADPLSMALANRLVGNQLDATAIEVTFGGLETVFNEKTAFALTGATAPAHLNGASIAHHRVHHARPGDTLTLGMPEQGVRTYVALAGGIAAKAVLGSTSTYPPAGLGGLEGRALRTGDRLALAGPASIVEEHAVTPQALRPAMSHSWALRAVVSGEWHLLSPTAQAVLFETVFTASRRADRMGIALEGFQLDLASSGRMQSAPVFPGMLQCPEDGMPFLLGVDAQTTGGYPRLLQIARCDRHLIGQVRPGNHVRFLRRTPEQAAADLAAKRAILSDWLGQGAL